MKRNRLIKFITIVVVFCLVFALSIITASAMSVEEATNAVFRVVAKATDGTSLVETCFAIGTPGEPVQYFITTANIANYPLLDKKTFNIMRSRDDLIKVKVFNTLASENVTILQSSEKLYGVEPLPLASAADVILASENYYSLGFPNVAIGATVSAYGTDVSVTQGIISKRTQVNGVDVYQTDVDINFGSFGGPVIDSNGNVIAINQFSTGQSGINAATQIDYITDVLDSRGIKYAKAAVATPATPAPATPAPATPAPATPAPATPAPATPAPVITPAPAPIPVVAPPAKMNKTTLYIIIGASALLLLIIIAVIVLLAKKGKQAPQQAGFNQFTPPNNFEPVGETMAQTQAKEEPAEGASLKCITGKLMGSKFELNGGVSIAMGRDPKLCQVVFGADSGAISRKHCTLRYNASNNTFILEDSSTNGTFLENGKRLASGKAYTLNTGDKFYLDTKKNTFQVTIG